MSERFIVKGTRIKDTCLDEYLTLREVCEVLNRQHTLLTECESEFRKYDGRKLFTLEYVVYAEILNKISEVLDPK